MKTQLLKDFETFLDTQEQPTSVKPYYAWHKDNGFKAYLQDAKTALERGHVTHARQCVEWAKEAKKTYEIVSSKVA